MRKFLLLSIFSANFLLADVITLRADEWCPYNCQPDSQNPGFVVEIAKEVFSKAGHTVEYKLLPWKRTLQQVIDGTYVGAIGTGATDAKERGLIIPSVEQGYSGNVFVTKKENPWKYEGVESLASVKIGIISGYSYGEKIDKYIESAKDKPDMVQIVSGDDALTINLKKLDAGKIDVVIDDKAVLMLKIRELGMQDKIKIAGEDEAAPIYIGFSPKNPKSKEYAELLAKGTEELRKSGKLKEILAKYGLEDWKK